MLGFCRLELAQVQVLTRRRAWNMLGSERTEDTRSCPSTTQGERSWKNQKYQLPEFGHPVLRTVRHISTFMPSLRWQLPLNDPPVGVGPAFSRSLGICNWQGPQVESPLSDVGILLTVTFGQWLRSVPNFPGIPGSSRGEKSLTAIRLLILSGEFRGLWPSLPSYMLRTQ